MKGSQDSESCKLSGSKPTEAEDSSRKKKNKRKNLSSAAVEGENPRISPEDSSGDPEAVSQLPGKENGTFDAKSQSPSKKRKRIKNNSSFGEKKEGGGGEASAKSSSSAAATEEAAAHAEADSPSAAAAAAEAEVLVHKKSGVIDTSQTFKEFGAVHLDRRLTKALIDELKLQHPTHVQAQVVPVALNGKDLLIEGKTGSGKTLAYVLPLLQRLLQLQQQQQQHQQASETAALPDLSGMVLVPTKELCIQVHDVIKSMLKYTSDILSVSHTASLPGNPGKLLELPTIMVGTPTGILHFLNNIRRQQQQFELQLGLEVLVVDEADLLFAFGFENDTKRLLQLLPSTAARHYQTILVSATQNHELSQLQHLMLHKPLIIKIVEEEGSHADGSAASCISEFYFQVPTEAEKWLVAYAFLRLGLVPLKCLVFCKDVSSVYALRLFLDRFGIASGVLSPTLPVAAREQQIQAFNQGLIDILITNDGQFMEGKNPPADGESSGSAEASAPTPSTGKRRREDQTKAKDSEFAGHRGLDMQGVACVFNFDAPSSLKSYIHRIGRTGRGGSMGVAVTLIDASQEQQQLLLQQLLTVRRAPGSNCSTLTPLSLQLQDVECFRYRVEDVRRGITKRVIAAAVARDLQQQLLNSGKLKEFFERNPRDRDVLKRACKQLKEINVSKGPLGHLPDYLLSQTQPTQMTAVQLAIQQQAAETADKKGPYRSSHRHPVTDPLKTFRAAVSRGAATGKRRPLRPKINRQTQLARMPKHPDEVAPEALPATSGRKIWKLRHNKRVAVKGPKGNFLRKRSVKGLRKK
ncbi:ATP-dependent nucleolar RNA helicase, putative [Eimeria tenella]|uniref:RNA helicase n=1 Tax=Eimeria tenella TaxID=5802 RepID=U6KVX7_EIMTE|nr:ATP-dependent nucleolar RNA helicase, putative [Eimeria tenella]CDJ42292.1 ATP-dependent nucleolar RNA helicase, putative [Eimeria tenella]|eukprot:XP_013233042.1 ATP-dependent nucleolar RNA helicase, putative [Eimeria tenella]